MNHRNVFGENNHQVSAIVVSSEKRGKVIKGTCTGVERTRDLQPSANPCLNKTVNGENVSFVLIDRLFSADFYKKLDSW